MSKGWICDSRAEGRDVGETYCQRGAGGGGGEPADMLPRPLSLWPNLMPDLVPRGTLNFLKFSDEHLVLPPFYR